MLVMGKRLVKKIEQSSLQLHLDSTEPEQVDSYKLLGVTIDSQLTFDQKRIAVLWKIRRSLPLDQRKLFFIIQRSSRQCCMPQLCGHPAL